MVNFDQVLGSSCVSFDAVGEQNMLSERLGDRSSMWFYAIARQSWLRYLNVQPPSDFDG